MSNHESDLEFCHHLSAKGYKPYAIMDDKEIISYPWPEGDKVFINARTVPGDPTTMKKFQIVLARLVEPY